MRTPQASNGNGLTLYHPRARGRNYVRWLHAYSGLPLGLLPWCRPVITLVSLKWDPDTRPEMRVRALNDRR